MQELSMKNTLFKGICCNSIKKSVCLFAFVGLKRKVLGSVFQGKFFFKKKKKRSWQPAQNYNPE